VQKPPNRSGLVSANSVNSAVSPCVTSALTAEGIKARAKALGFDACGICAADAYPELTFFADWVARGYAASMEYLTKSAVVRSDIRHVLPGARSVIVTATLYNTDRPYSSDLAPEVARISRYAWGDDYHDVLKDRLDRLVEWMRRESSEPFEARTVTRNAWRIGSGLVTSS